MFKRYFIAGLLVWLPLGVTILIIKLLVGLVDTAVSQIPEAYRPETLLGVEIHAVGIILSILVMLVIIVVTGLLVTNLFGKKIVAAWESLLGRIPLVSTIYHSAKQVAETLFSSSGKSFRKVLMIEYPRKGLYTLCFLTGSSVGEVQYRTGGEVVTVFVPTTPNPTSGFILLVPTTDVVELDMTVDEALKLIISLGVVEPTWNKGRIPSSGPSAGAEVAENTSSP